MHWFKIYHGYSSDPKLALVAHKMQESRATINGIFIDLLEYASKQEERGSLVGYNVEAGALAMGVSDEFMSDVMSQLRNVTLVTDEKVVNWDKYQSGSDSTAAERQRRHRDKLKQSVNGMSRDSNVTSPLRNVEKSREEKRRKEVYTLGFSDLPAEWSEWCVKELSWSETTIHETWAEFKDYWTIGKGKKTQRSDWMLSWKKWCRNQRVQAKAKAQNDDSIYAGVKI